MTGSRGLHPLEVFGAVLDVKVRVDGRQDDEKESGNESWFLVRTYWKLSSPCPFIEPRGLLLSLLIVQVRLYILPPG